MLKTEFLCSTVLCVLLATVAHPISKANAQGAVQANADSDLSGRITFDLVNWIRHETEAIVDVALPDGDLRRTASGKYGWRHPSGDLVYLEGCGAYINRIVIERAAGGRDIVSPCSSEIPAVGSGKPKFEFARLSPDKRYVAAEAKIYVSPSYRYGVAVFEAGKLVATFDGHSSPTWMPDGRLLMSGDGLYVTEVNGKPERLDDGWLGYGVVNPDVSPDGQIVVFEWKEQLWIMDSDGKEYKELVSGPAQYRFPAWSPNGFFVAFLAVTGSSHSEVDRALHFIDIRKGELHRVDLSRFGGKLNHVPFGPLSWTE